MPYWTPPTPPSSPHPAWQPSFIVAPYSPLMMLRTPVFAHPKTYAQATASSHLSYHWPTPQASVVPDAPQQHTRQQSRSHRGPVAKRLDFGSQEMGRRSKVFIQAAVSLVKQEPSVVKQVQREDASSTSLPKKEHSALHDRRNELQDDPQNGLMEQEQNGLMEQEIVRFATETQDALMSPLPLNTMAETGLRPKHTPSSSVATSAHGCFPSTRKRKPTQKKHTYFLSSTYKDTVFLSACELNRLCRRAV